MPKADTLIRTKLHPPAIRAGLVSRPRLRQMLERGLRSPLILITAPAGFGKTTLAAAYAAECKMNVAWLSLDKEDNQARRFLAYLIAALQSADSRIGLETAQLASEASEALQDAVLTSLINDLAGLNSEILLVLDDYQFIINQAVHAALAFLLEHCPEALHILIATRSDPPLPLARLRARAQTVELRAADLRFTTSEAFQFLNDAMNLNLEAEVVAVLEERTEGWIAGLQMAALSLRGRQDVKSFIHEFAGTHRFIMDYMLEEVLAREPQEVQDFLMQTSVLTRLCGELCDAVTGASGRQQMLEQLDKRNLFVVPLDDERRWYRYHHLFADLLQARFNQADPGQVSLVQSRAALWCEQEGHPAEAIQYALAARDIQLAARLIASHWHVAASQGEVETAWGWLNALPKEIIINSPTLGIACCWVLWLQGKIAAIEPYLADAENAFSRLLLNADAKTEGAEQASLPAHFAILRSIIHSFRNNYAEAIQHAERALSLVPEALSQQSATQLRSLIYLALSGAYDSAGNLQKAVEAYSETIRLSRIIRSASGISYTFLYVRALFLLGRLRAAKEACSEGLAYLRAQNLERLPAAGVVHVAMSEVLIEQNELSSAQDHLNLGLELGKRSGRLDAARNAVRALTRLHLARGELERAFAVIHEAEMAVGEPTPLAKAEMLALKARTLVQAGQINEAAFNAQEAEQLTRLNRGQISGMVALSSARVLLAQRSPEKAVEELTQSLADMVACGWQGAALELRILRCLARMRQGSPQEAETDLESALALAEPEGYVRIFLDEGQPMRTLISQWLAHAPESPLHAYGTRLLGQFDADPQPVSTTESYSSAQSLFEPLSQRELEVLQLMAEGGTNQEIARQLFVAPGTVKAHTASIYRKLGAANRTEAAAKARQFGLLP